MKRSTRVSIGPRPFGHGNITVPLPLPIDTPPFQLGHVLSDMEITVNVYYVTGEGEDGWFQLGHVLSDMEIVWKRSR